MTLTEFLSDDRLVDINHPILAKILQNHLDKLGYTNPYSSTYSESKNCLCVYTEKSYTWRQTNFDPKRTKTSAEEILSLEEEIDLSLTEEEVQILAAMMGATVNVDAKLFSKLDQAVKKRKYILCNIEIHKSDFESYEAY